MDEKKFVKPTPYNDEGCFNCRYRTKKIEGDSFVFWCDVHKIRSYELDWCEGWENEKGYSLCFKE